MTKSNLKRRSNVYLRSPEKTLKDDTKFVHHVRGSSAIKKLLRMMAVPPGRAGEDDIEKLVRQGKLSLAQQKILQWEIRCSNCDCFPCGVNFDSSLEFRCDLPGCK